jgi:hypothetical protein
VNVANAKNQSFSIHTNDGGYDVFVIIIIICCDVLDVVVGNQFVPCSTILYIYIILKGGARGCSGAFYIYIMF